MSSCVRRWPAGMGPGRAHRQRPIATRQHLLGKYDVLPRDLFRLNPGPKMRLRPYAEQMAKGSRVYDFHMDERGFLNPSPDTGKFEGPNGFSLRPNTHMLQELVRRVGNRPAMIYRLEAGTQLRDWDFVCLWEHTEHFALQTTTPVRWETFNRKLTQFFAERSEPLTIEMFCDRYPKSSATRR